MAGDHLLQFGTAGSTSPCFAGRKLLMWVRKRKDRRKNPGNAALPECSLGEHAFQCKVRLLMLSFAALKPMQRC